MARFTLLVLLSLVAASCAQRTSATDGRPAIGGPDSNVSSSQLPSGLNPGGPMLPTSIRVTPRPGMADLNPVSWDHVDVAPDDRTLTIRFTGGVAPCYVLDHVDVKQAAAAVTITLFQGHDPGVKGVACIDLGVTEEVTVVLDSPLAGREILDGSRPPKP